MDDTELALMRRRAPDLGLFAGSTCADEYPAKPRITMPGAGELARRESRPEPTKGQAAVLRALQAAGRPMTRNEIAEWAGMSVNGANARVRELSDPSAWPVGTSPVYVEGRVGVEGSTATRSLVHLRHT